jgi:taurine transport system permease protein
VSIDETSTALAEKITFSTPKTLKVVKPWRSVVISILSVVVLLLVWEAVSYFEYIPPLYLPSPQAVLSKFWEAVSIGYMDATLGQHLAASLTRIGLALAAAVLFAVPVGLAIGLNRVTRAVLDPLIEFYRPVPPLGACPRIDHSYEPNYSVRKNFNFF